MKRTIGLMTATAAVAGSLLLSGAAFAQTPTPSSSNPQGGQHGGWGAPGQHMPQGVFGTVSAISGSTLTVTSKGFGGFGPHASSTSAQSTTYSVDASNATVTKDGATSSLSSVAVGDMVMVQGTVSGDSVAATSIRDGMMPRMQNGQGQHQPGAQIQGNGEPVVGGAVASIGGSTLTVTNKSNVTYTIDASSATVIKGNATSTLSAVAVGDDVLVQGTVNGTAVTATSVLDQGAPKTASSGSGIASKLPAPVGKIFGGIGAFFQHLFGFF